MSNAGSSETLQAAVARLQDEIAELRASRRRVAAAAHADRRAFERDLHDGVQQHIVALAVDLRRLAELVDRDPAAAKALLAEMTATVRAALDEATKLATSIYPAMLDGRSLASALRSAAGSAGLTALVDVSSIADAAPEILTAVYWTCVEAMSSASAGSQVAVEVLEADGGLTFNVTISGRHPEGRLERLRDRINAVDGRLGVADRQDGNSHVHGWVPPSP